MNKIISEILQKHDVDLGLFVPSSQSPQVLQGTVPGNHAVEIWQALRAQFPATSTWPIIRGKNDNDLDDDDPCDPVATLSQIPTGNIPELLAARLAERIETWSEFIKGLDKDITLESFIAKVDASGAMRFHGQPNTQTPWPTSRILTHNLSIHSARDRKTKGPHSSVRFALITLNHPYEAPAHLGFGGWNDAPLPELQVAMLREWNITHGAVPIAITHDVLECVVDRPPYTEAEAMAVAADQWIFCDDIVSQGTQSVRNLAIELWRSPQWFFWWD